MSARKLPTIRPLHTMSLQRPNLLRDFVRVQFLPFAPSFPYREICSNIIHEGIFSLISLTPAKFELCSVPVPVLVAAGGCRRSALRDDAALYRGGTCRTSLSIIIVECRAPRIDLRYPSVQKVSLSDFGLGTMMRKETCMTSCPHVRRLTSRKSP